MGLAFQLVRGMLLSTMLGLWLAPALWVYVDARARFEHASAPRRLLLAALALPVLGPLLYACFRPLETSAERYERKLTLRYLEQTLEPAERCLVCREPVDDRFLRCPSCATELKQACPECEEPLKLHWNACPYCLAQLADPAPVLRLTA